MVKSAENKKKIALQGFRCCILGCTFLFATACSMVSPEVNDEISTVDAVYDDYTKVVAEDNIPLKNPERDALYTVGDIDKNLTAEELRLVEKYYKSYLHRGHDSIGRFMYRAIPYLTYVRKVFRDKGLPEDLAYLAIIESGYNPWAVSRSNAVGMWQFMAPTGRQYGLTQDWWMDERRDPYKATVAAAAYLTKLHGDFDDWFLAIAAYNAGEGKIGRALAASGATSFFELVDKNKKIRKSLRLKEETIQYVPRFIAMVKIMRNFDQLGFKPVEHTLKTKPMITQVAVGVSSRPGTDLVAVASALGMSWKDFSAYNPAFRRYITPPNKSTMFYVPKNLQYKAISVGKKAGVTGWSVYRIANGDTLSGISKKTGVPISVLRQCNRISEPLRIGVALRVPGRAGSMNSYVAAAKQSAEFHNNTGYLYTVRRGDTFSGIAEKHGISMGQLANANPSIKNTKNIHDGQRLKVIASTKVAQKNHTPNKSTHISKTAQKTVRKSPLASFTHTVKKGDTFYSIAKQHDVSIAYLKKRNPQADPKTLRLGQKVALGVTKSTFLEAIRIRNMVDYRVQKGDTFISIATNNGIPAQELVTMNPQVESTSNLALGQIINVPLHNIEENQQAKVAIPLAIVASIDDVEVKNYRVQKGDTFSSIATRSGISMQELATMNPQMISTSKIALGQSINIPSVSELENTVETFRERMVQGTRYQVAKGDNLTAIARKHGMSLAELMEMNPTLNTQAKLALGQNLDVKKVARPIMAKIALDNMVKSEKSLISHIVKKGDTFIRIAKQYNLSIAQLKELNPHVTAPSQLKLGQKLFVLAQIAGNQLASYTVAHGDTFWSISKKFSMTKDELFTLNNITTNYALYAGNVIKVRAL